MNRGQAVFVVSRKSGLDDTVGSDELKLMQTWWNDGILEVLKRTHCYVATGTISLTASPPPPYRISTSWLAILDLQIASSGYSDYERVSVDEIRDLVRRGSNRLVFATQGDMFWVNPPPTTNDTADIVGVPMPTLGAADGTTASDSVDPSVGANGGIRVEYHRAIEYYMLWQAAEYDDKRMAESPRDYAQQFDDECKEIRRLNRGFGTRRASRIKVGYPSNQYRSARNDVYPGYER